QQLSPKDVRRSLYYSQAFFFFLAILSSYSIFRRQIEWPTLFHLSWHDILIYGIGLAVLIVVFEILLYRFIDEKHLDDGGLNEKVFKGLSVYHVFLIALIVAIAEEVLFRGVIQTVFGYIMASSTFALLHYRYLKKPVLFILLVGISF